MLQGIRVIRVAASTDGGKWLVDTPLLKLIHPFDHRCLCLALRPDVIEHWATDLSGPVQYIDQTCYLLPSNLIPRVILHLLHIDISFHLEQAFVIDRFSTLHRQISDGGGVQKQLTKS